MSDTDSLTPSQQAAVEHVDGPLLVLAGPGSGKTRVITRRIAHLIEHSVSPRNILAITFTNKAADEMKRRVEALTRDRGMWVSTFHRFCARLLRTHAGSVGLQSNYTILDARDQKQVLRRVISDLGLDPVHYSPEKVGYRISNAKNDLVDADSFVARYNESVADHLQAVVARVYPAYQRWLLESNAVDFDDLLLHTATLLSENAELRESLDERFRYILVDEYQDTNIAQYRIVAALSQRHPNLCVTGDPDQSIYGWRGARIENILKFEREFPQAQVVRLEANFRSTQAIVRSADRLISHNRQRKAKSLTTDNHEGGPVQLLCYQDEMDEADGIASRIRKLAADDGRTYADIAVFYRVNALSRQLELALLRHRVPFQVAAGVAFYDRAEIKDLLCYLRLVYNPADRSAFLRVINTPLRGLGKTSQQRLLSWAAQQKLNFIEAAARAGEVPKLSKRAVTAFRAFAGLISELSLADAGSVEALLTTIIEKTRYVKPWEGSESEQDQDRLANVRELLTAARQYDEFMADDTSLEGFLEQTVLVNETDSLDHTQGRVTLMTLHAAKGLEFPVVFILGVEEGLIPHERATRDADRQELEEERRLLFVGMTRAEEQLHLTQTTTRGLRGRSVYTIPSSFLSELECEFVERDGSDSAVPLWLHDSSESGSGPDTADSRRAPRRVRATDGEGSEPIDFDRQPLLTTAADLMNGDRKQATLPQGFGRGMQVRHPRYGLGTVVNVGGFGARRTVTVTFADGDRTETFVAAQSPLQPVGG